jgi:hypothetical protein
LEFSFAFRFEFGFGVELGSWWRCSTHGTRPTLHHRKWLLKWSKLGDRTGENSTVR